MIDAIRRTIGRSQRPAAKWLRTYVTYLTDPVETLDTWKSLVAEEESLVGQGAGSKPLLIGLLRWYAEALTKHQGLGAAEEASRQLVGLETEEPKGVIDSADWLIDQQAWPLFDELVKRFPRQFNDEAMYIYCRAEALQQQGQQEAAEELAQQARLAKAEAAAHFGIAARLEQRGMIEWAVGEYQQVFDLTEVGSIEDIWSRTRLSELLHDQARDMEAGEVLKVIIDLIESDRVIARRMRLAPSRPRRNQVADAFLFRRTLSPTGRSPTADRATASGHRG